MFHSARIKLTLWYLLIIMTVSLMFSLFIYALLSNEVERVVTLQQFRIERRFQADIVFPPTFNPVDLDLINDVKHRLFLILLGINGTILVTSGGLGYLLAGRTLKPICDMVSDQNRFISDSSHELRTPLTALKTSMEVALRNKKLSITQAKKLISDNISDVNQLQLLSDGLLKLAQFQKSDLVLKFETVSLEDIVDKSIQKILPIAADKHIDIINQTKDIKFSANPVQLSELFIILFDNAIKYSHPDKKIIVSSSRHDGIIQILVKDQGIGISPSDLLHIFDRFYRANTARSKTDVGGYGLGLSIARKIVESHHGKITAKSLEGKGTTFIIRLPYKHFS